MRSLLLILCHVVATHAITLSAAQKHPSLQARDSHLTPSKDGHELLFADDDAYDLDNPRAAAARVTLEPHLPMIVLEDHTTHLHRVICTPGQMHVTFRSFDSLQKAEDAWTRFDAFTIVTTDESCATDGYHQAYDASYLSTDETTLSLYLRVESKSLQEVNVDMHVDYGTHIVPSLGPRLELRAATTTLPSSTRRTSSLPTSSTSKIQFPSATQNPTTNSMTDSFKVVQSNAAILPPEAKIAELLPQLPIAPPDFEMRCRECVIEGQVTLIAAGFSTSGSATSQIASLVKGYLNFTVNAMHTKMALDWDFKPGFKLTDVTAVLPDIRLAGIKINDVIDLGLFITPTFPLSAQLGSAVKVQAGFDFEVPKDSRLILNTTSTGKPSGSFSGFEGSKFSLLPMGLSAPGLAVNFTAAFKPIFKLSAKPERQANSTSGGIGVAFDFPQLNGQVKPLTDVNAQCQPSTSNSDKGDYLSFTPSLIYTVNAIYDLVVNDRTVADGERELARAYQQLGQVCYKYRDKSADFVDTITGASVANPTGSATGIVVPMAGAILCAVAGVFLVWL